MSNSFSASVARVMHKSEPQNFYIPWKDLMFLLFGVFGIQLVMGFIHARSTIPSSGAYVYNLMQTSVFSSLLVTLHLKIEGVKNQLHETRNFSLPIIISAISKKAPDKSRE